MRTWFLKVFEQEPVRELCGEKHDFTVPLTVEVFGKLCTCDRNTSGKTCTWNGKDLRLKYLTSETILLRSETSFDTCGQKFWLWKT